MSQRTVLITGLGHSGTTFVARVLRQAGFDFGQDIFDVTVDPEGNEVPPGGPHGMEWAPLQEFLGDIAKEALTDYNQMGGIEWLRKCADPEWGEEYRKPLRDLAAQAPEFIKAPWFMRWLERWILYTDRQPDLVIVSYRDPRQVKQSYLRWARIFQISIAMPLWGCLRRP